MTSVFENPKTGPATFARILCRRFVQDNIDFKIITSDTTATDDYIIPVKKTRIAFFVYYKLWKKAKQVVSSYPDKFVILHYNNSFPYLCFGKIGNFSIIQMNDYFNIVFKPFFIPGLTLRQTFSYMMRKYLERITVKRADKIICNSIYTRNVLQERYHIPEDALQVIYKSIDDTLLSEKTASLPNGSILYIGNNYKFKGLDILLDALFALQNNCVKKVFIAGPAKLSTSLRKKVTLLSGRIQIVQIYAVPHRQLLDYMLECDVVIIPGRYEAFGVSVLEAIAQGVPVLTAGVGGLKEMLAEYPPSFSDIENLKPIHLAANIENLYTHYEEYKRIADSKMNSIRQKFNSELMLYAIYNEYKNAK